MRMRRSTRAAMALPLLFAAALPAQQSKAPQRSPADAKYDELKAEFDAADANYRAALDELTKTAEYKKAVEARDREAMAALRKDLPAVDPAAFGRRFLDTAQGFTGEDRVPFLCWVALNSQAKDLAAQAVEELLQHHVKSPRLIDIAEGATALLRPLGAEQLDAALRRLHDDNPDALVRASAMYARAQILQRGRNVTDEARAEARTLLQEAEKLSEGTELHDRIVAPRFEKERLQIGMVAPDIAGEDLQGTPFKLSDYRGKVVVLDFWGFW